MSDKLDLVYDDEAPRPEDLVFDAPEFLQRDTQEPLPKLTDVGMGDLFARQLGSGFLDLPKAAATVAGALPALGDKLNPFVEPGQSPGADWWFEHTVKPLQEDQARYDLQPNERATVAAQRVGSAGRLVGNLPGLIASGGMLGPEAEAMQGAGLLTKLAAGAATAAPTLGASSGVNRATELADQGVDTPTAEKAGLGEAAAMTLLGMIPMAPTTGNILKKILVGAPAMAVANPALMSADAAAQNKILSDYPTQQQPVANPLELLTGEATPQDKKIITDRAISGALMSLLGVATPHSLPEVVPSRFNTDLQGLEGRPPPPAAPPPTPEPDLGPVKAPLSPKPPAFGVDLSSLETAQKPPAQQAAHDLGAAMAAEAVRQHVQTQAAPQTATDGLGPVASPHLAPDTAAKTQPVENKQENNVPQGTPQADWTSGGETQRVSILSSDKTHAVIQTPDGFKSKVPLAALKPVEEQGRKNNGLNNPQEPSPVGNGEIQPGNQVTWMSAKGPSQGEFVGMKEDGSAIVKLANGTMRRIAPKNMRLVQQTGDKNARPVSSDETQLHAEGRAGEVGGGPRSADIQQHPPEESGRTQGETQAQAEAQTADNTGAREGDVRQAGEARPVEGEQRVTATAVRGGGVEEDPFAAEEHAPTGILKDARLKNPDIVSRLKDFIHEAGWATRGGKLIRDGKGANAHEAMYVPHQVGEVVGKTPWVPGHEWYADFQREFGYPDDKGETISRIIQKMIDGKPLASKQMKAARWLLSHISQERAEVAGTGEEARQHQDRQDALIERAMKYDHDAVSNLAERTGDDEIAFMDGIDEIIKKHAAERLKNEGPFSIPKPDKPDLLGDNTQKKQSIADRVRAIEEKLGKGREQVPASEGGGLFSEETKQRDIADVGTGHTAEGVTDELHKSLGKSVVDNLTKSGRLKIVTSKELPQVAQDAGAAGHWDGKNKIMYLAADRIRPGEAVGTMLHEVFHSSMEKMLGKERFAALRKQYERLLADNVPEAVLSARRVPKDTNPDLVHEEQMAYMLQEVVDRMESGKTISAKARNFFDNVVSSLRAYAFKNGPAFLKNIKLTPRDFATLARMAAKVEGKESMSAHTIQQETTPQFLGWSDGHPVVHADELESHPFKDSEPVVVEAYRGTTGERSVYKPVGEFAKEGDLGSPAVYGTSSAKDASQNYAGHGPDRQVRIDLEAEKLMGDMSANGKDISYEEAKRIVTTRHAKNPGIVQKLYLKMTKPAVIGGEGETVLRHEYVEDENGDISETKGTLPEFAQAIRDASSDYYEGDADAALDDLLLHDEIPLGKAIDILKRDNRFGHFIDNDGIGGASEIIRQALENMGYDGIIDRTVNDKFGTGREKRIGVPGVGMKGINEKTAHYVVFNEKQVKNAIGNSGEFAYKGEKAGDSLHSIPRSRPVKEDEEGKVINPPAEQASVKDRVKQEFSKLSDALSLPKFTDFKRAVGKYTGRLQTIDKEIADEVKKIRRDISDSQQVAITNYIQAGGDRKVLAERAAASKPKYRKGYEDAMNLSPEMVKQAERFIQSHQKLFDAAQKAGLMETFVENYVRGQWERNTSQGRKLLALANSGKFNTNAREAMKKIFDSYFEGEQLGYVPTDKRIGYQWAAAERSVRRAIAARTALAEMLKSKEEDGLPSVVVGGSGNKVDKKDGDELYVVRPNIKSDFNFMSSDGKGYTVIDHPAFRQWKWVGDADGKPIILKGNMWVHPKAKGRLNALLGNSIIRDYRIPEKVPFVGGRQPGKAALDAGAFVKGSILIGPFHQVHVGIHAVFHRVNPFHPGELNFDNRDILRIGVEHGLMLYNHNGMAEFGEGLTGGGLFNLASIKRWMPETYEKHPNLKYVSPGDWLKTYQEYLFQNYIPRLKADMYEHAVERAFKTYKDELDSGKLTKDQLYENAANQANAAFGELNYRYIGRDPTLQDFARLVALAPDFLEARLKFAGQALRPGGREQQVALVIGSILMSSIAQTVNLLFSDDHKVHLDKPFTMFIGDREYTPRSVMGDITHLISDWRGFTFNRLNPLFGRPVYELIAKRDSFGNKIDYNDIVKDIAKSWTPIPLQGLTKREGMGDTTMSSVMNGLLASVGVSNTQHKSRAEQTRSDISFGYVRSYTPEQKERYKKYENILLDYKHGKLNSRQDVESAAQASGVVLTKDQMKRIADSRLTGEEGRATQMEDRMKRFSAEEAMQVWDDMTDEEKMQHHAFIAGKIERSKTLEPDKKKEMYAKMAADAAEIQKEPSFLKKHVVLPQINTFSKRPFSKESQ